MKSLWQINIVIDHDPPASDLVILRELGAQLPPGRTVGYDRNMAITVHDVQSVGRLGDAR